MPLIAIKQAANKIPLNGLEDLAASMLLRISGKMFGLNWNATSPNDDAVATHRNVDDLPAIPDERRRFLGREDTPRAQGSTLVNALFSPANVMRSLEVARGGAASYLVDISVILEFRQLQR